MPESNNPYQLFLGIDVEPKCPDFGKVIGLDLDQASVDEIKAGFDSAIAKVRAQKPGDKTREWAWLIDQLKKAKVECDKLTVTKAQSPGEPPKPKGKSPGNATKAGVSSPRRKAAQPKQAAPKTAASASGTKTERPSASQPPAASESKTKTKQTTGKPQGNNKSANPKSESGKQKPAKNSADLLPAAAKPARPADEDADDFTLAAPDEGDSFDSDTHFSTSTFQSPGVTASTIDPMNPVADPTQNWAAFDVGQVDAHGFVKGATAVAEKQTSAAPTPAEPKPAPQVEKTFYGDVYRKKSNAGLMIGGTLLAMLIVGGITYVVLFGVPGNGNKLAQSDDSTKQNDNSSSSGDNSSSNGTSSNSKKSVDEPPQATSDDGKEESTNEEKNDDNSSKGDDNPTATQQTATNEEDPERKTGQPTPPEMNEPNDSDVTPKKGDDPAEMEKKEMEKAEQKPAPKPKNSDIAELAKLLTDIRAKLLERDFSEANRLLTRASELPKLPDHELMFQRLASVSSLYQKFWDKVVEGCGKLKALDEIKFSESNVVKIVEASEDRLVYRALGQRFEKDPRELQIGLAMKIAETVMDPLSGEGRSIKGSVFAIDAANNPDRADEARSIWQDAMLVGAETDELVLFLDDTYDSLLASVISKEKAPDEAASKEAQNRFREKYAEALKTASRNAKASSEFTKQLLADVPSFDESSDRHACLTAAVFYAGKSGEVELLMTALSDMNKWFSIDLEQQTLDALTKLNKTRLKPDQKREVMRTAFEYMDRSKTAMKKELELSFAELALAAAKGTRDPKLLQTATRELQRVKASVDPEQDK